jgi:glycerophosphoryl diester phosphodiesterase
MMNILIINNKPLLLAHRGSSGKFPEHTYASYQDAINQKVDYVEMDMLSTRDGEIVVLHSPNLDEITNISELKEFEKYKRVDYYDGTYHEGW